MVINSMEWAWCQFTLAKTVRQGQQKKKEKMAGVVKTPSLTMRGVPKVGHSSCAQRVHSVVDVVRRAIEALLADVVRVGVLTPLNHLERALALPLCMGISRPPEMLRRAVHRSRAFGHRGLEAYRQKTLGSTCRNSYLHTSVECWGRREIFCSCAKCLWLQDTQITRWRLI